MAGMRTPTLPFSGRLIMLDECVGIETESTYEGGVGILAKWLGFLLST
jgi:hypothetical protein